MERIVRNLRLKHLLLSTSLLSLTPFLAVPASAQQADQPSADEKGETVVITGTRILQPGYVSASPITTVDAEQLGVKNPVDVEDVLRQMPQFAPGNGGQVNNGSSGASTLDLRGLTEPRTL